MTVDGVNGNRPTPGQVYRDLRHLDAKDGNMDGNITQDNYNDFYGQFGGYSILEQESITVSDALKRIAKETKYDEEFENKLIMLSEFERIAKNNNDKLNNKDQKIGIQSIFSQNRIDK